MLLLLGWDDSDMDDEDDEWSPEDVPADEVYEPTDEDLRYLAEWMRQLGRDL